jgi:hypothetical protein
MIAVTVCGVLLGEDAGDLREGVEQFGAHDFGGLGVQGSEFGFDGCRVRIRAR